MLSVFIKQHGFPPGSAHLNQISNPLKYNPIKHKHQAIESIIGAFPNRKFILVGDSGEADLETYNNIAKEFPGKIARIYIHDVTHPRIKGTKRKVVQSVEGEEKEEGGTARIRDFDQRVKKAFEEKAAEDGCIFQDPLDLREITQPLYRW